MSSAPRLIAKTVSIIHDDSLLAGKELARELLDELGRPPHLVLLFAWAKYDQARLLEGLYAELPATTRLVGCSSYGEINSEEAVAGTATAMGLIFEGIAFETFAVEGGRDGFSVGKTLGEQVQAFAPTLLMVFPDGLRMNSTQFLLGLQSVLGREFPIIGGISADDGSFSQTYEYSDRRAFSWGAVAVALKGPIEVVTAAKSGWVPIGTTRTCTKVEDGNVLLELDGKPALSFYKDYLGYRASEMPMVAVEFPIGVVGGVPGTQRMPDGDILLMRAIKGVDEARQAIVFGGDVPEGAEIRMTRAIKDDVIQGAIAATAQVKSQQEDPGVALIFNCMARKIVLGSRYKDELKEPMKQLGPGVPKIGFYTYGELSPVQGVTMHHDETFTLALLRVKSP
jgi:hypothetical protein